MSAEVAKIVDGLAREARTANARYEAIAKNFEGLKKQMGAVNDRSIQLESLERDATVNRNLLEAMLLRAKQSTGAETILQANAKLVSPAAPSSAPSYPPKALIALLGVAGGMMVGAAIALMREGGDHTFRRAEQIEARPDCRSWPWCRRSPAVPRRRCRCCASRHRPTARRCAAFTSASSCPKRSPRPRPSCSVRRRRRKASR